MTTGWVMSPEEWQLIQSQGPTPGGEVNTLAQPGAYTTAELATLQQSAGGGTGNTQVAATAYQQALDEYKQKFIQYLWKMGYIPPWTGSADPAIERYWANQLAAIQDWANKVYHGTYLTAVPASERELVDLYLRANTDWTGTPTEAAKQQWNVSQWQQVKQEAEKTGKTSDLADLARATLPDYGYTAEQLNFMGDQAVISAYDDLVNKGTISFAGAANQTPTSTTTNGQTTTGETTGATTTTDVWKSDPTKYPAEDPGAGREWEYNPSIMSWVTVKSAGATGAGAQPTTQTGWGKQWTQNPTTGEWVEGPMSSTDQLAQAQWANLPENWYQVAALERNMPETERRYNYAVPQVVQSFWPGMPQNATDISGAGNYNFTLPSGQQYGALSDVEQRQLQGWANSGLANVTDWQSYQDKIKELGAPSGYEGWLRYRR